MADTEIKKGLAGVVVDYTAVSKVHHRQSDTRAAHRSVTETTFIGSISKWLRQHDQHRRDPARVS